MVAISNQYAVVILNAGIRNTPLGYSVDGFEKQFAVNHLSHFLLTKLLTPILLSSSTPSFHSRVIAVSSSDHRNFSDAPINWEDINYKADPSKYTPAKAYTQSKLANMYMATELNRRFADQGLTANAIHPGGIMTGLQQGDNGNAIREILTTPKLWPHLLRIGRQMKSVEQGASTSVWAAVASELEGQGGLYLTDCGIAEMVKGGEIGLDPGYGVKAFDGEAEKKLWRISCEMVGIDN